MKNVLPRGERVKKEIMEIVEGLKKQMAEGFEHRLYKVEKLDGGLGHECLHMIGRTEDMQLHFDAVGLLFQDIWETVDNPKDPQLGLENVSKYTWAVATLVNEIEDGMKDIRNSLDRVYDLVKTVHGWEAKA